jgi:hypothetical protein
MYYYENNTRLFSPDFVVVLLTTKPLAVKIDLPRSFTLITLAADDIGLNEVSQVPHPQKQD